MDPRIIFFNKRKFPFPPKFGILEMNYSKLYFCHLINKYTTNTCEQIGNINI